MDGTDPLNQQVNDIPSSHVFMDWGTGKAGAVGALYLEKAHDPTSKSAHAMNGQLFDTLVRQPMQTYSYHVMMNGMPARSPPSRPATFRATISWTSRRAMPRR